MNEPFSQLVATLHKAQGTMVTQLDRLAKCPTPDKLRMTRMQSEAQQLGAAAAALLAKMMQKEASPDLLVQTKVLVATFESAERRAASLHWRQCRAETERVDELDDEAGDAVGGPHENETPIAATTAGSCRTGPELRSKARNARVAHQLVGLGLSGTRAAASGQRRRQRSPS